MDLLIDHEHRLTCLYRHLPLVLLDELRDLVALPHLYAILKLVLIQLLLLIVSFVLEFFIHSKASLVSLIVIEIAQPLSISSTEVTRLILNELEQVFPPPV